jgi:hypothetical protein
LGEYFIHPHEAPPQEVLLGQDVDGWKMANFLLVVQLEKVLRLDMPVSPHDVPLLRFLGTLHHPPQLLHHCLDDIVVCLCLVAALLDRLTTISSGFTSSMVFLMNLGGASFFLLLRVE